MLYHLSKNDPIELSSLGRLVPRFTKSSTVGERMARVRFLQMVQLIPVISVETKNQEYLRRHSFYSGNFSPGWTVPFDIPSEKNGFSLQMVSAPDLLTALKEKRWEKRWEKRQTDRQTSKQINTTTFSWTFVPWPHRWWRHSDIAESHATVHCIVLCCKDRNQWTSTRKFGTKPTLCMQWFAIFVLVQLLCIRCALLILFYFTSLSWKRIFHKWEQSSNSFGSPGMSRAEHSDA